MLPCILKTASRRSILHRCYAFRVFSSVSIGISGSEPALESVLLLRSQSLALHRVSWVTECKSRTSSDMVSQVIIINWRRGVSSYYKKGIPAHNNYVTKWPTLEYFMKSYFVVRQQFFTPHYQTLIVARIRECWNSMLYILIDNGYHRLPWRNLWLRGTNEVWQREGIGVVSCELYWTFIYLLMR